MEKERPWERERNNFCIFLYENRLIFVSLKKNNEGTELLCKNLVNYGEGGRTFEMATAQECLAITES